MGQGDQRLGRGRAGIDHAAAHAPVLRAEVAGDYLEFGNRIGRWLHHLARIALITGRVRIVIHAVEQEIVIRAAHPVYVEGCLARCAVGSKKTADGRFIHVGREQREIGIVAAIERQLKNLPRVHRLAVFTGIGLENRRCSRDFDRLRNGAHLHGEIDALTRANPHFYILGGDLREARLFYRDGIGSGFHVEKIVIALGAGRGFGFHPGALIQQCDRSLGEAAAFGIAHRAEHFSGFELRRQRRGEKQ